MFFGNLYISIERYDVEIIKLNYYNECNRFEFLSFFNSFVLLTLWKFEIIIS